MQYILKYRPSMVIQKKRVLTNLGLLLGIEVIGESCTQYTLKKYIEHSRHLDMDTKFEVPEITPKVLEELRRFKKCVDISIVEHVD